MTEEKDKGIGDPPPASGENPPEDQQGNNNPPAGLPDKTTELEKQLQQEKEEKEKMKKQIEQAGYTIEQLKGKMKEAGVEVDEEKGISTEQVQEIVKRSNEELTAQFGEKFTELMKTIANLSKSPSIGGGGDKPPAPQHPMPTDPAFQRLIKKGWKWDDQKGVVVSPRGKEVDLNDWSDLGVLA